MTIGQVVLTLNEAPSQAAAPAAPATSPASAPPQAPSAPAAAPAAPSAPAAAASAAPPSGGESVTFNIPNLGDGIKGGDVLNVLVKVGDTVAKDQGVLELETDKATIEVPSSVAGTVTEIKVKAGDKVTIGQAVIVLAGSAAAPAPAKASPEQAAPAPSFGGKTGDDEAEGQRTG